MSSSLPNQKTKTCEDRFEQLTAILHEGSLVVRSGGCVSFANEVARQKYSILPGDTFHLPPFLSENDREVIYTTVQVSHANGEQSSIPATLRVTTTEWEDEQAYLVVIQDNSEIDRAEEALRQSEERYRAMVEGQSDMIFRYRPDGTITFANQAACRTFGKPREELVGANLFEFIPREHQSACLKRIRGLVREPRLDMSEFPILTTERHTRWMQVTDQPLTDPDGSVGEFQSVGRDITERRQEEQAFSSSEQQLRKMLQSYHLAAVMLDIEGRVTFANHFLLQMTGYSADELQGQSWLELMIPPEEQERVGKGLRKMLSGQAAIPYAENDILTRSGERRLIGWNSTILFDSHGRISGVSTIGEDLTERAWSSKLQEVIHHISQGAQSAATMDDLYALIHASLKKVMPVDNFFIALYDREKDEVRFPYFVDQYDEQPAPQKASRGLTEYVLRTGAPLLASPEVFDNLAERGEVESLGAASVDWLGVPLKTGKGTIGAMVAQSYTEGVRFGQRELQILDFVSTQIAMTIERKRAEQGLRENEEKYRALVEASSEAIFLETGEGDILDCNSAACAMLGYTKDELLTLTVKDLVPEGFFPHIASIFQEQQGDNLRGEAYNRRKDGSFFPVEVTTRPVQIGGENLLVVYVSDISRRRRREREMDAIAGVSAALRTAITQADILPVILQQLIDRLSVMGAFVSLRNGSGGSKIELGCGTWAALSGQSMPATNCNICAKVIETGEMYVNNEWDNDPHFPFPELVNGVHAIASVPLVAQDQIYGALTVAYRQPIETDELHILTAICDIAASAIQRARLYEQTSRQANEVAAAYDATIEGWALALELRDKETQGHSRRVTELTLRLAAAMDLPESELTHIRRGVLLHDIGKMGIPDRILLKPGGLDEEEWIIMRKHPDYAREMLATVTYLGPARDIPYCHHEKWDGTGYPRRLKGEQIPLYARIFAVVDVLDALTSDRPYRPAWPLSEALAYIRRQSGLHFDPQVVDAFINLMEGVA